MATYVEVHPVDPQPRAIAKAVALLRGDGLVAYPTDSCFAFGCRLGNTAGLQRIRAIRRLDDRHHFTLVCRDFAQAGRFVHVSNAVFRTVKASIPGRYTFILPATKEVPRQVTQQKTRTVGIRVPEHPVVRALLTELGEPILSSTLVLPGDDRPMTDGWEIKERLDRDVDMVIDSGECGVEPTTIVDLSTDEPRVVRRGAGDPARFE